MPATRVLPDVADESNECVISFPVVEGCGRLSIGATACRGSSRAVEGCDCAIKVVLFQTTIMFELVKLGDFECLSFSYHVREEPICSTISGSATVLHRRSHLVRSKTS